MWIPSGMGKAGKGDSAGFHLSPPVVQGTSSPELMAIKSAVVQYRDREQENL